MTTTGARHSTFICEQWEMASIEEEAARREGGEGADAVGGHISNIFFSLSLASISVGIILLT